MTSEQELAAEFGVSRITIRTALARLAREGLVVRVPGRGTYIADVRKLQPQFALTSFSENMVAMGRQPGHRTLSVEEKLATPELANALQLQMGEPVLHIERLLLADEVPTALMSAHLPPWVYMPGRNLFTTEELDRASLYDVLEDKLGIDLWLATETVEAQRSGSDGTHLDVGPEDLLLVVERLTTDPLGRVVECTRLRYRADLYQYQTQLYRHGSLPITPATD